MPHFVAFIDGGSEPLSLADVKANLRIDPDLTEDDALIESVIIPGARQQAEALTGSVIRQARFVQRLSSFPRNGMPFCLDHGLVDAVESITYLPAAAMERVALPVEQYEVVHSGIETEIGLLGGKDWPAVGNSLRAVEITYRAGLNASDFSARFPSVRQWMLAVTTWGYENAALFMPAHGKQGFQALPDKFVNALLASLTIRPRV